MVNLENLIIYKEYVEMIYYTISILMEFPLNSDISKDIKKITYEGLNYIINAQKEEDVHKRILFLDQLDATLKTLKVLVRISYKKKHINAKNHKIWNKKITNISNLTWTWIKSCQNRESFIH